MDRVGSLIFDDDKIIGTCAGRSAGCTAGRTAGCTAKLDLAAGRLIPFSKAHLSVNASCLLIYLAPPYPTSKQIDLTDDYVVVSIFGDGSWERLIQKVTAKDDGGSMIDARLDQEAFRDLISIMQ